MPLGHGRSLARPRNPANVQGFGLENIYHPVRGQVGDFLQALKPFASGDRHRMALATATVARMSVDITGVSNHIG